MARPEASVLEVEVESSQLEFLECKAKELGISKEELVRMYIAKAIDAPIVYVFMHKPMSSGYRLSSRCRDKDGPFDLNAVFTQVAKDHSDMVVSAGGHKCAAGMFFQKEVTMMEMIDFIKTTIEPKVLENAGYSS